MRHAFTDITRKALIVMRGKERGSVGTTLQRARRRRRSSVVRASHAAAFRFIVLRYAPEEARKARARAAAPLRRMA